MRLTGKPSRGDHPPKKRFEQAAVPAGHPKTNHEHEEQEGRLYPKLANSSTSRRDGLGSVIGSAPRVFHADPIHTIPLAPSHQTLKRLALNSRAAREEPDMGPVNAGQIVSHRLIRDS